MFEKLKSIWSKIFTSPQSVADLLKNPVTNHPGTSATTTSTPTAPSSTVPDTVLVNRKINTDATIAQGGQLKKKDWVEEIYKKDAN